MTTAIAWFREDLRLEDNPALTAAATRADAVVPVWTGPADPTAIAKAERTASSLASLARALRAAGSDLVVRTGDAAAVLGSVAHETGATLVTCTRDWSPAGMDIERRVSEALERSGVELAVNEGSMLVAPDAIKTASGRPFSVFTPYYRAWTARWHAEKPLPAPARLTPPPRMPASEALDRRPAARSGPIEPGAASAIARLAEFVSGEIAGYATDRDRPGVRGTSELSAALASGELGPRQVAWALRDLPSDVREPFVRQLAWREFAAHVLHHHPESERQPLRPEFSAMPWRGDDEAFDAWRQGRTGFPLVDAGMRQLAQTGWMHNRVRMVVASFLAKDLLVPWQQGERHFRENLVDFDVASNVFNWQWVAGSGADAAPYFRVFNPTLQGRRFDPDGAYVRRWVPELAALPDGWVHRPAEAPTSVLEAASVVLGETYPRPMIDHAEARQRALAAFASLRHGSGA